MGVVKCEAWRNPGDGEAEPYLWDVSKLEYVLRQAAAPKATFGKQLWCVRLILRCIEKAKPHERVELRRNCHLVPTLQYFLSQSVSTPSGVRLHQRTLSVYLQLLGWDLVLDELLLMDVSTVNVLAAALGDEEHFGLNYVAVLLARRISELPHVSSILVFEDRLFDALQDLLELRQVSPVVTQHILYLFVNLSGHPKLHFKLARSRRLVFFAIETLFRVLKMEIVEQTSKKMQRVMNSVTSPADDPSVMSRRQQTLAITPELSREVGCTLKHISTVVSCTMIIANLLSFSENRTSMLSLFPEIVCALELCLSQKVSVRLWEVARCATDYLHEDKTMMEMQLLMHLESPKLEDRTVTNGVCK
ncbi:hypothetical protein TraAM80_00686 [Trypanosoma rangeli]|uniref:Uncharacterized protein n=1 Tax=Trypanosoma rangeli TaxID=5698 RepID=A0A422P2A0_TRYRA|nr:uncharacterized protein TraAM80_00686 [Trypanosoma rangeli]RNF11851.1 hypothetical protein TraAM80_00686 [Trypanosoma rangeli]|eukprot:RNF11851.1 hypothetical protein TraAM80_00686 [Trypanosoma rangeli]